MSEEDKLYCPKCGSTQLTANKKGFGAGKAAAGAILTGGVGLLAGFIGSGNVKITCLKCGATMKPGELRTTPLPDEINLYKRQNENNQGADGGCVIAFVVIVFLVIISCVAMCS